MKYLLLSLSLILPLLNFSQNKIDFGRTYSDTLPERLKVEISELKEHIYRGIPSYSKQGKYEKVTYKFADKAASGISGLLSSGYVYSDWKTLEDYLNEILKRVIPQELLQDSFIHVYVFQDGDLNAFMTPSGQLFFNIGTLSEFNSEAKINLLSWTL